MDHTFTILTDKDGDQLYCGYDGCDNSAIKEYCGYCEACWLKLTSEERAVLLGKEPPVKEIITHRTITTRIPPAWEQVAVLLWRAAVTGALTYLGLKAKGWL